MLHKLPIFAWLSVKTALRFLLLFVAFLAAVYFIATTVNVESTQPWRIAHPMLTMTVLGSLYWAMLIYVFVRTWKYGKSLFAGVRV